MARFSGELPIEIAVGTRENPKSERVMKIQLVVVGFLLAATACGSRAQTSPPCTNAPHAESVTDCSACGRASRNLREWEDAPDSRLERPNPFAGRT
jgi:hypothetical protein